MSEEKPDLRLKQNRPTKQNQAPVKKGRSSWAPASLNEFEGKEDGYRYRMVNKDPKNLAKKKAEGWETVSKLNNANLEHQDAGRIQDGKPLDSTQQGHDWVLMRLDEDTAKERDAYWDNESKRRVAGLTAHIKNEIGKEGATTHGNITISSLRGEQIIE